VDSTGRPTAWEAVDIVQPDWDQNDPTAADYVKNRICYNEKVTQESTLGTITLSSTE